MAKNDGGPIAFEECGHVRHETAVVTLRDFFAAHLYQVTLLPDRDGLENEDFEGAARDAYRRADAMLAARDKE